MALTEFFLRNRPFALVAFVFLLALGVRSFHTIPRSEDPVLDVPAYRVLAVAPGTDPVDMEKLIVRPLEDAMKELDDVRDLAATIRDSVAVLVVEFEYGTDTEKKYDEVVRQVNVERPDLPSTMSRLEVLRVQTSSVAIIQTALVSAEASYARLQDLAETLRKRLESVPGVRKAEQHAFPEKEVRVSLDVNALAKRQLTIQQVLAAIQAANAVIPGGGVEVGDRRVNVKTTGVFTSLDQVRNIPLTIPGGSSPGVAYLRDVAEVDWDYEEEVVFGRFDGERAVFVTAMMQDGRNIFEVREGLGQRLDAFRQELPADVRLELGFDQSRNVRHRLARLEHDFALALGLVLLTLAPLGFRPALIVMISIPLCLALGLAAMQWSGFSLNQLSIVGCVIALGLVVDDTIVVVENIARFRRQGHPPLESARLATRQIYVAVLGTTATLLFAFIPLLLLPEGAGQFIRSLPAAVAYSVLASLFVALAIVPWLASLLLTGAENPEGNPLLRLFHGGIAAFYRPILHHCMRRRRATIAVAALICGASFSLIPVIGFSLFPKADTPQFLVQINAEEGASIAATDSIARKVEELLRQWPEVKATFTSVGKGNPQVYYNLFQGDEKASVAEIFVCLKRFDPKTTPAKIEALRRQADLIPGARIVFKEFENGPPISAPIEVRVVGEDLAELARLGAEVESMLRSTPGTRDIDNPARVRRTDLRVRFDAEQLAMLGITERTAEEALRLAFAGLEAGKFRESNGDERAIRVVLPQERRATLATWSGAQVPTGQGAFTPLSQIAALELSGAPGLVERRNRERLVTVSAFPQSGFNTDRLTREIQAKLEQFPWPAGYRYEFGGEVESRQESFAGFGGAILMAVFGILAILVLEFRSFRGTLVVASVIPLGVVGGLIGLWLAGYTLSFTSMIGFIALIGIEIKNSILLVDFTNQLRREGVPLDEAIERAGETRFLPVVLTTLTALGALIPLAAQNSALYSPLAVVIIGGSISSLLLSRLVTPVLYRIFPPAEAPAQEGEISRTPDSIPLLRS